eukprot:383357-Rhodomonas_salina.1
MRSIRVLFLRSTPQDPWMNRAVSFFDPPFCHVEVEFDGPVQVSVDMFSMLTVSRAPSTPMATSIYANEAVFLRPLTFANPNYTILTLDVSEENYLRMYCYAEKCARDRVSFASTSMLLSLFPLPFSTLPVRGTFCSAYVTTLLQQGNVEAVKHAIPSRMRPSTLHKMLRNAPQSSLSSV